MYLSFICNVRFSQSKTPKNKDPKICEQKKMYRQVWAGNGNFSEEIRRLYLKSIIYKNKIQQEKTPGSNYYFIFLSLHFMPCVDYGFQEKKNPPTFSMFSIFLEVICPRTLALYISIDNLCGLLLQ